MDDPRNDSLPCYNPLNMQSRYVDYNPANQSWVQPDEGLVELQKKFTVIGPMDQMDMVLCVVFIHYAGWVPSPIVTVLTGMKTRCMLQKCNLVTGLFIMVVRTIHHCSKTK